MKKVIKKLNPDIIHAHDYRASGMVSLFSKQYKTISHIHVNKSNMHSFNIYSILYEKLFERFNTIVWVSKSAYDDFYFKSKVKNKSIVLSNVIDGNFIINKSNLESYNDFYDLIFLGRLTKQKNPERLIDIASMIKKKKDDFKVAIVGGGEKYDLIANLIKERKLENNIKMYGFKNNPYPILKNSKLLIMTSIWEGTPMVALEAQAMSIPIISTPIDGLKDIIINGKNGYLLDSDEDFCNTIVDILNDTNKYEEMKKQSEIMFEQFNNLNVYKQKIREIYENE